MSERQRIDRATRQLDIASWILAAIMLGCASAAIITQIIGRT